MKINQLSNAILKNDAVSNQMLAIKNTLKELGHDSKIYVRWKDENLKDDSIITLSNIDETDFKLPVSLGISDIIFFHHHTESVLINILNNLDCIKILFYHNITPPQFFKNIDNNVSQTLLKGLEQLNQLKSLCQIAVGSKYSKIELEKIKFSKVFEIPFFVDKNQYTK